MTIAEIAVQMGADPADTILELVERSGARAGAIFFGIREEDLEHALTLPWTSIGSDGSALAPVGELAQSHPHPRSYGTFPRVLARYVRERGVLTLTEAIHKMTGLPAAQLGLADRGTRVLSVLQHDLAVYQQVGNALGKLVRRLECGQIADRLRVEHHNVGLVADHQRAVAGAGDPAEVSAMGGGVREYSVTAWC